MKRKLPILLLSCSLALLFLFFTHTEKRIEKISISPTPTALITQTPTPTPSIFKQSTMVVPSATSAPTSQPSPTNIPATPIPHYEIYLSINGGTAFSVSLPPDANQCEVLSKALEQGKIISLDMRYDETYKTYAVYKINNIGKENSVWWTYKINGTSPTQGCSYIKVTNGDIVEWKYLGS